MKTLDKMDIKALKKADQICFRYNKEQSTSVIECYAKMDNDPWNRTQSYNIEAGYKYQGFRSGLEPMEIESAFAMLHAPEYMSEWQTIMQLIKTGDAITLEWWFDNNSEHLRDAGLHRDELRLVIHRKEKNFTFLISITCAKTFGRMVKLRTKERATA